ncbi:MAG: Collagenase [Candidatus Moranbacteria bacterium GW2011_GWC1_45_18]|nr:MAG: Collagenase [Candidatus Moranbacteria bacterium GW2011_GWC2_40_12]KKU00814.1 MAG: Collagenase [Candidatus Moranbacteria bacterium GW2011_GWC1_45_18]HBB37363.1 hypothetical protein [Candidatus Moranbacteria bacterium]
MRAGLIINKNPMKKFLIASLIATSALGFLALENPAKADSGPHIVINEIQLSGALSNDEFIELFNPADDPIDLEGYKLSKKTKTGSSESILISTTKFLGTIQAHGYFLVAHPNYQDAIFADLPYSGSTYYISGDNTVFLYDKDGILLDKVGFGAVDYANSESKPAINPDANQSLCRTNFIDTDDNAADFSISNSPSPQNSSFAGSNNEELSDLDDGESPADIEDVGDIEDAFSDASGSCVSESPDINLNEIFPYPASGEEFVEVINTGESCVDVSGWKIMDESGHKKEFPENSTIGPGEYFFLKGNFYLNNDSDTVYLLNREADTKNDALDSIRYEKTRKNYSFSLGGENWRWTSEFTPGDENTFDSSESAGNKDESIADSGKASLTDSENVYINEILANPKDGSADEYIEIVNGESGPVDLHGWMIRDDSKSGKYVFKEHVEIGPGGYLALYKSESKISLNNSKESVYLYNPAGKIVSSASYEKSQKNASYNFDGKNWKWSKYLTPGETNKFDSQPSVKIKKPKKAFKDLFTEFSAKAKDKETKKLKYIWDFGDGKKSYLAKTSHKYQGTGKYTVTLTVSDDSQTIEKSFTISVKNYPLPDLEIVKIVPNPTGADSNNETIDLKNSSGKKVDLQGWKIATGAEEKVYNHPLSDGIALGPGEIKTITREVSRFSLNNKAGKVRLISPDDKIADEVEYSKDKIAEGEAYVKTNEEWRWISPPDNSSKKEDPSKEDSSDVENDENNSNDNGDILGAIDENQTDFAPKLTLYTPEDKFIFLKFFGLLGYKPQEENFCPVNQSPINLAYF